MTVIRIKCCCVLFLFYLLFGNCFKIVPIVPLVPNLRLNKPIVTVGRIVPMVPLYQQASRCCDEVTPSVHHKSKNLTSFLLGHITQNRLLPDQNAVDVLVSMATQGSTNSKHTETGVKIHRESNTLNESTSEVKESKERDDQKALKCATLECEPAELNTGPVCACNFKTGNTVTFKNECDVKKHNCRFDTEFKMIVAEICPWQYESRSGGLEDHHLYDDQRYYN